MTTQLNPAFVVPIGSIAAWAAGTESLVGQGGKRGEMQIFVAGEWNGHPGGPFSLTGSTFDTMIERFAAQKNPLPLDYDHSAPERGDSRAAGWITSLEKRIGNDGPELWAQVEYTPTAARMVEDGEYKYCSAWFDLDATDRVSGEKVGPELLNVALTNIPFIDGMKPLRLSRTSKPKKFAGQLVLLAQQPPGVSDKDAPPPAPAQQPPAQSPTAQPPGAPAQPTPENDQATMLNQKITTAVDQMAATAGADRVAVVEMLAVMADEIGGLMAQRLERDQTPAEDKPMEPKKEEKPAPASDEERMASIKQEATENTLKLVLSKLETIEASEKARTEREAKAAEEAVTTRINALVADGVLQETERKSATWVLSTDPEQFKAIYGGRTGFNKPVPIGVTHAGPEGGHRTMARTVDADKATESDLLALERPYFDTLIARKVPRADALKRTLARREATIRQAEHLGLEVN